MSDWIETIVSAWTGHRQFAEFLVETKNPDVVVELGVDYGYSTFVFANSLQGKQGKIYGIDLFAGDIHAGHRNTYEFVMDTIQRQNLTQVEIVKGEFTEVSKNWSVPIDILHIDGLHTFDAVKTDYENWSPFVKDDGIILFHDIASFPDIARFFSNVDGGWHKLYFVHSAGLGILTKNIGLRDTILNNFQNVFDFSKRPF
jgi:predicted O-methyltransferase YrrM